MNAAVLPDTERWPTVSASGLAALAALRDEEGRALTEVVDTYRALARATLQRRLDTGHLSQEQAARLTAALDGSDGGAD